MNSIVVYASRYGNTEKVAMSIAAGLRKSGPTLVCAVAEAPNTIPEDVDLVVVGGPTEGHSMTGLVSAYLDKVGRNGLAGKAAAAFDTRLNQPRWLSGSAAVGIARKLRAAGALLVSEPVSFFVAGKQPGLVPGEFERAEAWATALTESAAMARTGRREEVMSR